MVSDAVIGNPPYIRIQTMKQWAPAEVEFYKKRYQAAAAGNYDIYVVFIEKGLELLNPTGRLGYICPHKFFNAKYGEGIRRLIAEGQHLEHVVHFGDQQVFQGATTYTCLLFLASCAVQACEYAEATDLPEWRSKAGLPDGIYRLRRHNTERMESHGGRESRSLSEAPGYALYLGSLLGTHLPGTRHQCRPDLHPRSSGR